MDLYKLIIMVVFLNLGISLAIAAAEDGNAWDNFTGRTWITNLNSQSSEVYEGMTDAEILSSQQAETTIEDTGGISKVIITGLLMFVIVGKILFGSLLVIGAISQGVTTGNEIIQIIAWGIGLFVAILYILLGTKIYAWFANKDTR